MSSEVANILRSIIAIREGLLARARQPNCQVDGATSEDEIDRLTIEVLNARLELARYLESKGVKQ